MAMISMYDDDNQYLILNICLSACLCAFAMLCVYYCVHLVI
jgi:hypothetical protein